VLEEDVPEIVSQLELMAMAMAMAMLSIEIFR
jgi:hypothetical protein